MLKDLFNGKFILNSGRLAWIDYARGGCIIFVCYRHCMEGLKQAGFPLDDYPLLKILNICFYSFRMPLFFIISGLFLSAGLAKKGLGNYINSRFKIVFYPLLLWGTIQISIQFLLKNYVNAQREPIDYLNLIISPRHIEQFWYLNALFFVGALYAIMKVKFRFQLWQQILLGIAFYTVAGMLHYTGTDGYLFTDILNYYIYFGIGDMLSRYMLGKKNKKTVLTHPVWVFASLIVFLASQFLYTVINLSHNYDLYVLEKLPALAFFISLSGCAFTIQVSFLLQRLNVLRWLRVIGYHSLYIYLVHVMVIAAVRIFLVHVLHVNSVPLILLPAMLAGVIIPILLYNISVRLGAWWLFSLKKPEEEIKFHSQQMAIV
ncbi:MAG: acyltransferase [Bacteroidetes bacterium]|nr:acyltransferase [Bacteroidota bacterium]